MSTVIRSVGRCLVEGKARIREVIGGGTVEDAFLFGFYDTKLKLCRRQLILGSATKRTIQVINWTKMMFLGVSGELGSF